MLPFLAIIWGFAAAAYPKAMHLSPAPPARGSSNTRSSNICPMQSESHPPALARMGRNSWERLWVGEAGRLLQRYKASFPSWPEKRVTGR